MSTKAESALARVQNLYLLRLELWHFLDSVETSKEDCDVAKKHLREFSSLLGDVDWRVMGGEDVLVELESVKREVAVKLKAASKTSVKRSGPPRGKIGASVASRSRTVAAKPKKALVKKSKTIKKSKKRK